MLSRSALDITIRCILNMAASRLFLLTTQKMKITEKNFQNLCGLNRHSLKNKIALLSCASYVIITTLNTLTERKKNEKTRRYDSKANSWQAHGRR